MEEDDVRASYSVIIIGGSAGSLEPIMQIIGDIRDITLPIIIVLHRKPAVDSALVDILAPRSSYAIKEAEEKDAIVSSTIYIAPGDYHLLIESDYSISLDASEKVNFSRPSIDVSFESAAEAYGASAVAVLLSGGSSDGVEGLKKIKARGGICVVQEPESAVVDFMPRQAIEQVEIDQLLHARDIGKYLNSLV